ncbi:uncharacterized protein LOC113850623 [Abrus precatorius]|uniref:Uncharacterized protein LOC113850623 n=1 Tax=Abrus precatorius TaxID=3816 RepID=A0A8B8K0K9_ABRPR|nr:uncharacterized protein LOC113850623 [Abrus precatorius]
MGRDSLVEATAKIPVNIAQVSELLVYDQSAEVVKSHGLPTFIGHRPPKFEEEFDSERAWKWIADVERVFSSMDCQEEHKVDYATFMLIGKVEDWWKITSDILSKEGRFVTWDTFKTSFLENHFPGDLKKQEEREVLRLKQGEMLVKKYAVKFHELMKYWIYFQQKNDDKDWCNQFENGLRSDLRKVVSIFQLMDLPTLVSKCIMLEDSLKGELVNDKTGGLLRQEKKVNRFSRDLLKNH